MLVSLLVVGLGVAAIGVIEGNPVEWGKQRYYDVVDKREVVAGVRAFDEPGDAEVPEVTDNDSATFWDSPRAADAPQLTDCPDTFPEQALRLEWPDAVRVRGLRIAPSLTNKNQRLARPRPETLLVRWESEAGFVCLPLTLEDDPEPVEEDIDTEVEVDRLWVAVGSVHEAESAEPRGVPIRTLRVLRRP